MIFVTLGTQKFQMNRLLKLLDDLVAEKQITDRIIAQVGLSDYVPQNYEFEKFIERDEFDRLYAEADLIISHSGAGVITKAAKTNKPIIVFPRLKKYGEHVDDHQVEIAQAFAKKGYAFYCGENDSLVYLMQQCRPESFTKFETEGGRMVGIIEDFLRNSV